MWGGLVFENSAACVYVETSTVQRLAPIRQMLTGEDKTLSCPGFGGTDFEHKLKVKKTGRTESEFRPVCRPSIFTESLILAQDERWRRA